LVRVELTENFYGIKDKGQPGRSGFDGPKGDRGPIVISIFLDLFGLRFDGGTNLGA
jgi:hypothetical protein